MARTRFLDKFLTHLDAAPAVLDLAVSRYGASRLDALCANPRFGARLAPLLSRASARALLSALGTMDYAVLDATLTSPTRSLQVLESVPTCWDLSLADQRRLVARRLPVKAARQLMGRRSLSSEVQSTAAKYVDAPSVATWLSHSRAANLDLSDDTVFTHLTAVASAGVVLSTLVPVLLARPALRPRALQGSWYLRAAACWTPLSPGDLTVALEWLARVGDRDAGSGHDPQVAVLAQLGLPADYRATRMKGRTWDVSDSRLTRRFGVPSPSSPLFAEGDLATAHDPEYLDLVLDRVTIPPHERGAQLIWGGQLLELARSPHLDSAQSERVLSGLVAYAVASDVPAFRHAAARLAKALHPRTDPVTLLKDYGLNYAEESALTDDLIRPRYPRRSIPIAKVEKIRPPRGARPPSSDAYSDSSIESLAANNVRMDSVVSHVCQALGEGITSDSQAAWTNFFHFLDNSPTQPLAVVLDTARLLVIE